MKKLYSPRYLIDCVEIDLPVSLGDCCSSEDIYSQYISLAAGLRTEVASSHILLSRHFPSQSGQLCLPMKQVYSDPVKKLPTKYTPYFALRFTLLRMSARAEEGEKSDGRFHKSSAPRKFYVEMSYV
ncbi:hypothetical protein J6590_044305 [Homalodisca vitripennis]|nr:hypothetical protein J6590_044305 [Homalodisca vitripennis]